ncbi:MAG: hypothetical protein M5R40_18710 [Anaerolineae bacterium]|nr:hypothetical protein [Anaerolineae bacterium]
MRDRLGEKRVSMDIKAWLPRVRWWIVVVGAIALVLALPTPARAHETDEAHIEPAVILLAAGIPIVIIAVGGVVAYFALRAQKGAGRPHDTATQDAPDAGRRTS